MPDDGTIAKEIRKDLEAMEWSSGTIIEVLGSLPKAFDGLWSYGTARMIKDLAATYARLEAQYGEPPDGRW